jgi:hypothetical protein
MRSFKKTILFSSLLVLLASCYKTPEDINNDDLDMTITIGDKTRNFTQYNTFTVDDTIKLVKILNGGTVESDSVMGDSDAAYIMNELIKKMNTFGYTYTADTSLADLHIIAHAMDVISEGSGVDCYDPGYWYGYGGGYYYPGWGYPSYGYPWYGGCYSYSYFNRKGTIIWDLFDRKNHNGTQIEVVWTASIIGVLNESGNLNKYSRIDRGINEAFLQSPYLDKSSN